MGSRLRTAPLRGCLEAGPVGTSTQAEEEVWGRGLEGRAREAAGLREEAWPGAGLGRDGPGAVELGAPHLAPSPLPGVHSLRVARGKKVGEAEARGPGQRGRLEGEILSFLTPYPVPRNSSSSC